jgi:chitin deacetylase
LNEERQGIPEWARGKTFHKVAVADKCVALTFDDGPWPDSTTRILTILKEHDARATFFMIGMQIRQYPKLAEAVKEAGHAIGNHSWSHRLKPEDAGAEVERADSAIRDVLGLKPTLFRPPFGNLTNGTVAKAKHADEAVLIWSVDTYDWKRPGAAVIAGRATRGTRPGGIVLLHDGGGDRRQTVAALPRILKDLKRRGYRFVTVPELLALSPNQSTPMSARSAGLIGGRRLKSNGRPRISEAAAGTG